MSHNETPKKPEWFEMAEQDVNPADYIEESSRSLKSSMRMPLVALLATGAILAGGAVFANVKQKTPAGAENVTATHNDFAPEEDFTPTEPGTNSSVRKPIDPPLNNGAQGNDRINPPTSEDGEHIFVPGQRPPHEEGDEEHLFPRRGHHEHDDDDDDDSISGTKGGIPSTNG